MPFEVMVISTVLLILACCIFTNVVNPAMGARVGRRLAAAILDDDLTITACRISDFTVGLHVTSFIFDDEDMIALQSEIVCTKIERFTRHRDITVIIDRPLTAGGTMGLRLMLPISMMHSGWMTGFEMGMTGELLRMRGLRYST